MKKVILLTLAAFAFTLNGGAQVFNHLSIGVGTGLDGTGIEVASTLGEHFQIRAGYNTAFGIGYTINNAFSVPVHPGVENGAKQAVPLKVCLGRNDGKLIFNYYPSAKKKFYIAAGFYLGEGTFAKGIAMNLPSDYNTMGFEAGDYAVKAFDSKIEMQARAYGFSAAPFAVKPYLGVGWGRPFNEDKRVTFAFDLGVQYQGKVALYAMGESVTGRKEMVDVSNSAFIKEMMGGDLEKYGKYAMFWPTLSFHVYVKLF